MNNILSVENLCLWYGSHQALKDINIEIPEKSIPVWQQEQLVIAAR